MADIENILESKTMETSDTPNEFRTPFSYPYGTKTSLFETRRCQIPRTDEIDLTDKRKNSSCALKSYFNKEK